MPLDVYLLTFNCARTLVTPHVLARNFFDAKDKNGRLPDVVAISLQEVSPIADAFLGPSYVEPYISKIAEAVDIAAANGSHTGGTSQQAYRLLQWHAVGMMVVMVMVKEEILDSISNVTVGSVGVGYDKMANKGAAGIRFSVDRGSAEEPVSLTFVAAHLYPHEKDIQRRNEDWENIVRNLVFEPVFHNDSRANNIESEPLLSDQRSSPTSRFFNPTSHLFFFGDLNYRTGDLRPATDAHLAFPCATAELTEPRHYSKLLQQDQLSREKRAGRTLHGLTEQPIDFPPTYKYEHPTDHEVQGTTADQEEWSFAKKRFPSWCDRIFFTADPNLKPHVYTCLPVQPTSDHRPVALSVTVIGGRNPSGEHNEDDRINARFPLNRGWKAQRTTARSKEVVVGAGAWIALTRSGNIAAAMVLGIGFITWWIASGWQ